MSFEIEAACGSVTGNSMDRNEDNFYFRKKHLPVENDGMRTPLGYQCDTDDPVLFAVFDGMGGESDGNVAAYTACRVFCEQMRDTEDVVVNGKKFFIMTASLANKEICRIAEENKVDSMGTTVAALYFLQNEVYSCNVGDSKIFRVRGGRMAQISEDHTDGKLMQAMGISKKPVLLQYLGMGERDTLIDPFISKGELNSGDYYIACSDGVTDAVPPAMLYEIIMEYKDPERIVAKVMNVIESQENSDNSTLIIARIG